MKLIRSSLFIPGNKPQWMEKAVKYGSDSLTLDLEDSVPDREKEAARGLVRQGLKALARLGQDCSVRINGFDTGMTEGDLEGVICPELRSVALPKIETVEDVARLDEMLTKLEKANNLEVRSISTPLGMETAKAMRNQYDIMVSSPRVTGVTLACGARGDANRSLGYVWSKQGTETLYVRSKTVLDARAAGIEYPTISSWWDIRDLEGLEDDARFNRSLGFRGQVVMHPSHVPVVNKVFTPTPEEIAYNKGLIEAMDEAERKGSAAVIYGGDMVDIAMAKSAREMLEFANSIGMDV